MGSSNRKIMPEKIVLEDGTEREVPTAEELKSLQETADKSKQELETLQKELGIQEGVSITDSIKELKESANPNWPAAREKMKKLQTLAKEKGIDFDDNGNVVEKNTYNPADIDKKIADQTNATIFSAKKEEVLSKYNTEERKVVEHYLNKLMTGEEQTVGNVLRFQQEAEKLAFPDRKVDPVKQAFNTSGGAPRYGQQAGQVSAGAVEMGRVFGNTEEKLKQAGDVSDLLLNK